MSTHVDEEVIAAVALGDPSVSDPEVAHVRSCTRCAGVLAELDRIQDLLRHQVVTEDEQRAPDLALWERVAAATGGEHDPVRSLTSRKERARPSAASRPSRLLFAAAAAACVLAGLGIGRLVWGSQEPPTRVLAATSLNALDGSRTLGEAQLLDEAGRTELRVSATPAPPPSGFVEVWLLNEDGRRMVSLGVLDTSGTVFSVPPGAVNQGYRVVDLSRERYDSDARHSGDSIMRGTLPA